MPEEAAVFSLAVSDIEYGLEVIGFQQLEYCMQAKIGMKVVCLQRVALLMFVHPLLRTEVTGFTPFFFKQADILNAHAAVSGLAHVVNREQAAGDCG